MRRRGCSRKVRMSPLCKAEMSAFLRAGRWPDGRGQLGSTREGSVESTARTRTGPSATKKLRFRGRYLPLVACLATGFASPSRLRPTGLAKPRINAPKEIKRKYYLPKKGTFLLCVE